MATRDRIIDIPLGLGQDEEPFDQALGSPQLEHAQEAEFLKGAVRKRRSYTALGTSGGPATPVSWSLLAKYGEQERLLALSEAGLHRYNDTDSKWVATNPLGPRAVGVSREQVARRDTGCTDVQAALTDNGYLGFIYLSGGVYWLLVQEESTRTVLSVDELTGLDSKAQIVAFQTNRFFIIGDDSGAGGHSAYIASVSSGVVSLGSKVVISGSTALPGTYHLAAIPTESNVYLFGAGSNLIMRQYSDASFNVPQQDAAENVGSIASATALDLVRHVDSGDLIALYLDSSNDVYAFRCSTSVGSIGTPTKNTIHSFSAPDLSPSLGSLTEFPDGTLVAAWSGQNVAVASWPQSLGIRYASLTASAVLSGSVSAVTWQMALNGKGPRVLTKTGSEFVFWPARVDYPEASQGQTQATPNDQGELGSHWSEPTGILVQPDTDGNGTATLRIISVYGRDLIPSASTGFALVHTSRAVELATGEYLFASPVLTQQSLGILQGSGLRTLFSEENSGADAFLFNMDPDPVPTAESAALTLIGGGALWAYDGDQAGECNLVSAPHAPWIEDSDITNFVGSLTNAYATYVVCWRWRDRQGRIHRTAPSPPLEVREPESSGGASDAGISGVVLHAFVPPSNWIQQIGAKEVYLEVYQSPGDGTQGQANGTYWLVGSKKLAPNASAPWAMTYDDSTGGDSGTAVTTDLTNGTALYTTGGVLPNSPAPVPYDIVASKSRLFAIDAEDRRDVWTSKTLGVTTGPEWNANLVISLPESAKPAEALALVGERVVIFTADEIFAFVAEPGPNNLGQGSFGQVRRVSSDTGCVNRRSVAQTDAGVFFQGARGFYVLTPGLSVEYVGGPVEDTLATETASASIHSACVIPERSLVRWCVANRFFDFDYRLGQWSTHEGPTGYLGAASPWRSIHSIERNGQHVYASVESSGETLTSGVNVEDDDAHICDFDIRTGWFRVAGLQGYKRVKRAQILGRVEFTDTAGDAGDLRIDVYYDYETTSGDNYIVDLDTYTGGLDPFRHEIHLSRQKCSAIAFRIRHVRNPPNPLGQDPAEDDVQITLTGVSLKVGFKRGLGKITPTTQRTASS